MPVSTLTSVFRSSERSRPLLLSGVFDSLTARIAADTGFNAIWLSGLCVTASHAVPDNGTLPRIEYLERTREISATVPLPLLVDGEHGFGDVGESAALFQAAGASGLCLEDQAGPKRNSLRRGDHAILTAEEATERIRHARRSTKPGSFAIVARTEALIAGESVLSALDRLRRYAEAGADAVIVHSREATGLDVLRTASMYCGPVPLGVIPTRFYRLSSAQLSEAGVQFVIYANQGLRAMIAAYRQCSETIVRTGSSATIEDAIASLEDVFQLQEPVSAFPVQNNATQKASSLS